MTIAVLVLCAAQALAYPYWWYRRVGKSFVPGDPIDANSGRFYFTLSLFDLGGPLPLTYQVFYHSDQTPGEAFGTRFDHNVPFIAFRGATSGGTNLMVQSFNGQDDWVWFRRTNTVIRLAYDAGPRYTLAESGSFSNGWYYLTDPAMERVYVFEKIAVMLLAPHARLRWVFDRNYNRLSYLYANATNPYPYRIEDGLGRHVDLDYETGRVSRVTDPAGRTASFLYYSNLVSGLVEPAGGTNRFEYVGPGLMTRWVRPLGQAPVVNNYAVTELAGNTQIRVASQTDAYGHRMQLQYASNQPQTVVEYPDTTTARVTSSNEDGPPLAVQDAAGNTYALGIQGSFLVRSLTDRLGNKTGFGFEPNAGLVTAATNPLGRALNFEYAAQSQVFTNPVNGETVTSIFQNVSRALYANGTIESFGYDERGNLVVRTNPAGRVTRYEVNARGQVTNQVNPAGGVVTRVYATNGLLLSQTDHATGEVQSQYDAAFRLTNMVYPDGAQAGLGYDANDRVTFRRDELGRVTAFARDPNGNLVAATGPDGVPVRYGYDLMDRLVSVTDRLGRVTTRTYNNRGLIDSLTDPNGLVQQFGYDSNAWLTSRTLGGRTWQVIRDREGVEVASVTPLGHRTTYAYDAAGALVAVTNPLDQVLRIERDELNRAVAFADPLGRTHRFHYDAEGVLTGLVWSGLGVFRYDRDAQGRMERLVDSRGETWSFAYSPEGRLQSWADPLTNTWSVTYDVRGRVAAETRPDSTACSNTYDAAGRLVRRLHSDGLDLQWSYDALDRLVSANGLDLQRDAEGRITNTIQRGVSFAAAYDAGGRLERVSYNNGALVVTYRYDPVTGWLTNVSDNVSGASVSFQHNDDFRLVGMTRANGVASTFTLDDAGRLVRIQEGAFADLQYSLDAAGQATQAVTVAPLDPAAYLSAATDVLEVNAACEVVSAGYTHDPLGRRTASPGVAYTWDDASRLVGIQAAVLDYNGMDDVIRRVEAGQTNFFYYNRGLAEAPVVAEQDGNSGAFTRYYVWTPGGALLYLVDIAGGNAPRYFHFDLAGSTLALTDGAGAMTDSYAYDPHGRLLQQSGTQPQPFTFAGRFGVRQEGADGTLYQMRARYYDARSGRFLSREPLWPRLENAAALNPYVYARNNPVSLLDPSGLDVAEALLASCEALKQEHMEMLKDMSHVRDELDDIKSRFGNMAFAQYRLEPDSIPEDDRAEFEKVLQRVKRREMDIARLDVKADIQMLRIRQFLGRNREALLKALRLVKIQLWNEERRALFERQDQLNDLDRRIADARREALDALDRQDWDEAGRQADALEKLKADQKIVLNTVSPELFRLKDQALRLDQMLEQGRKMGLQLGDR